MRYIKYQTKRCKNLKIKIPPKSDFHTIFHTLNAISFPGLRANSSHIIYAILELVNNSLRAHREQNNSQKIIIEFLISQEKLLIRIEDRGGGFNPQNLPYDLYTNPESIELDSKDFHDYREKNGYLRFGMGLYLAKRTFPSFRLSFVDNKGHAIPWQPGMVAGTRIILGIGEGTYGSG